MGEQVAKLRCEICGIRVRYVLHFHEVMCPRCYEWVCRVLGIRSVFEEE